ncbi:bacteriohemerythrin [Azospirillum sp. ST 5-10]|uniref:bacteriohemerythrin n=1 Tax=unclassified Azospirillum TaxID=2630922 RepID=UPI003F49F0AA
MTAHATLVWTDALATGVPALDREHAALVALVQRLDDPARADGRAAVRALLDALTAEICRHFDEEERLMHASRYPDTAAHEEAHALLLKQLNNFVALQDTQAEGWANAHVVDFVGRWLIDHIREDDGRLGRFLAGRGG